MHRAGLGLPVDPEEALFRYRIASRLGDAKGGRLLNELRPEVPAAVALAADARAEEWLRQNGS
jgi:TPR repeat protein